MSTRKQIADMTTRELIQKSERLNRQSTKIVIAAAIILALNVILIVWRLRH